MTIRKERHETFLDFEMRKYYHQVKKPSETSKKYISDIIIEKNNKAPIGVETK